MEFLLHLQNDVKNWKCPDSYEIHLSWFMDMEAKKKGGYDNLNLLVIHIHVMASCDEADFPSPPV